MPASLRAMVCFSVVMVGLFSTRPVVGEVVIRAFWQGEAPTETTEPGQLCVVYADGRPALGQAVSGVALLPGDMLLAGACPGADEAAAGVSEGLLVQVACGEDAAPLQFSGPFEVLVVDDVSVDCAIDLAEGTLDYNADSSATITSGGVTLGVEGTRFTLVRQRARRSARRPDTSIPEPGTTTVLLFEGQVTVETRDRGATTLERTALEPGQTLRVDGARVRQGEVRVDDLVAVAGRSARLDVASSPTCRTGRVTQRCDPQQAVRELERVYEAALARPTDLARRADLAKSLQRYQLDDRARFELYQVGLDTVEELQVYELDPELIRGNIEPGGGAGPSGLETPPNESAPEPVEPPIVGLSTACEDASTVRGVRVCRPLDKPLTWVQTLDLRTEKGWVGLTLPRTLLPGEPVSGSMSVFPSAGSGSEAARRRNLKKLESYRVGLGSQSLPVQAGGWDGQLPTRGSEFSVSLETARGRKLVRHPVAFLRHGSAPTEFLAPSVCRAGRPMVVVGPFDGQRRTTRATFGGQPATILAESTREVTLLCPDTRPETWALWIEEAGRGGTAHVRSLQVTWEAPDLTEVRRGEVKTTIRGLQGFDHPVGLLLENKSRRDIRFVEGDEQLVKLFPEAWDRGDDFVLESTVECESTLRISASVEIELVPFVWNRLRP